jgi:hypothetical protein
MKVYTPTTVPLTFLRRPKPLVESNLAVNKTFLVSDKYFYSDTYKKYMPYFDAFCQQFVVMSSRGSGGRIRVTDD